MKNYDKNQLILEWRTGGFSTRQLGNRHGISHTMISRIVKGIEQDLEPVIKAKTEILASIQESLQKLPHFSDPKEIAIIDESVNFRLRLMNKIHDFTDVAMEKAIQIAGARTTNGSELKATVDAVDKLTITNGLSERHARPSSIMIDQNFHNNINNMTLEEIDKEIETLERML